MRGNGTGRKKNKNALVGNIEMESKRRTITHILTAEEFPEGIKDGYAILSIKRVEE